MDDRPLLLEVDDYIKGSIDHLVGLDVPEKTLRLKLFASEDSRRRLQDQIFLLQDRLRASERRLEQCKAEAGMNAQGLKRCVEEKEALGINCGELVNQCEKLERECSLYEKDMERLMESYDEMAKENDELKASRERDASTIKSLHSDNESLKKDKEYLRINLQRAEEEVKLLYEENKLLDKGNKLMRKELRKEKNQESEVKQSTNSSVKGKRKLTARESDSTKRKLDFAEEDSRQPLSSLHPNSPDSRRQKKQ